jgi:diguanylate cyclase (GGDEF)-like protein/PAS domain S-box-containing protein
MGKPSAPALSITAWQVLQSMQDGVVLTDAHGTIMAVNDAFCAVTGYSRAEAIGRNPSLLHSGKHDRAFYAQMWGTLRQSGAWQGEIWNRRKNGALYPEWLTISAIKDRWGHTLCYLGVSRDITSPKLNEERLKQLAQCDPLTGLPNRRLFHERLKRALSYHPTGRRLAVLFLDVDHFKDINDQWGHASGDAFLQAVASRLRGCVRRTDTIARWAGDEFAVLLNPVSGERDAERVARKILNILRRPFTVSGHRIKTSASIGACMLDSKSSPERLIAKADRMMYAVKKGGRNDIRFWPQADSLRHSLMPTQRAGAAKAAQSDRKRRRPRQVGVHETVFRA